MIEKLRDCFDEMVVYKDLKNSSYFSALGLPSFLRDWLLKKFADEDGVFDHDDMNDFIRDYLPRKEEWLRIQNQIIMENEYVKLLTRVSVEINIRTQRVSFSLPEFGLSAKDSVIEESVWERCSNDLVNGSECWGIVKLGYRPPHPEEKITDLKYGKIQLMDFRSFCPYDTELDYYKDMRQEFTVDEWIDVLLGAIDYNAEGYVYQSQKLAMLSRLLPFVEKNLNLIELAPKGTGKSYLFGHVSRHGLLVDGGKISRARMFYDASKRLPGFIFGHDFVAIDEVKLVTFNDDNEMRSILQGYMEYGAFNFNGFEGASDAGIIFLGNIDQANMDEYGNMLTELPELFQESALLDRIHGFIKGWDIPRMNDDLKVNGWALNSEYFCSIMHLLRDDLSYRAIVEKLVVTPPAADTRDTEAIKRLTTGFLKLLFPNVCSPEDIDPEDFDTYCLVPAMRMRNIIRIQQGIIDKEYLDREIPTFTVCDVNEKEVF